MIADPSRVGMGRRRQGDTEPGRSDDSNRSLDRAIDGAPGADDGYERGRQAGASGTDTPHEPVKPGTARDIERRLKEQD